MLGFAVYTDIWLFAFPTIQTPLQMRYVSALYISAVQTHAFSTVLYRLCDHLLAYLQGVAVQQLEQLHGFLG